MSLKERRKSKIEPPLLPATISAQAAGRRARCRKPSQPPATGAAARRGAARGGAGGRGGWLPATGPRPMALCARARPPAAAAPRRHTRRAAPLAAGGKGFGSGDQAGGAAKQQRRRRKGGKVRTRAARFSCNPLCCSPSSLARLGRHEASAARSARGGVHGDIYTHCATPLCALCLWPRAQSLTLQSRLPRDPLRPNSSAPTSLAAMAARARSQRLRHQQMRACRAWTSPRAPPWRTRSRW